jgi:hypothetical protein
MSRRTFLGAVSLAAMWLTFTSARARASTEFDQRLLGTWRSNRELTMKYWRFYPGISQAQKEQIAQRFGKLTWRFTETEYFYDLDDSHTSSPYWVIAKDAISVLVGIGTKQDANLQYIRFEENYFYILAPRHNLEFFTRIGA